MALFSAIAAAVTAVTGSAIFGAVASFAARTLLTIGITKLVANRANKTAAGSQDSGARVQLPPATNNKLPVVYGDAYIAPVITDAKISTDQRYMWYVCSLAEVTDSGAYTFGDIYWNGKKVIFGDLGDTGKVTSMETNSNPIQIDNKVSGKVYIWRFPNGSSSGIDTGASNAITIMSDSSTGGGIPSGERWNGPIYTSNGESADMTDVAFMIVRVEFNQDAGLTGLGSLNVELQNSLNKPGDVFLDYMQNERYGCAIPLASIDTVSLTNLNIYSDQTITYTPVGGGSSTQPRYRINGPMNTGINCLDNLQIIADSCDSWLQYSELTGTWKVVINQSYTQAGQTLSSLYQVTDSQLIGGINVNPIDLNSSYNVLEVQYPNANIKDQTDFRTIELIDYVPEVISKNEPVNALTVQFPIVNNYIQSLYLGIRRLLQSREDLTVDFTLDYSGIQIEAGDVICIPFTPYGWESFNSGYGKLFRVSQVQEAKLDDGSLGARITAFEYNDLVYTDNALQDFVPEGNSGLTDPNIIGTPDAPIVTLDLANTINTMSVSGNVPTVGSILMMDFNYGNSSNSQQHVRYTTVNSSNGEPFAANTVLTINSTDLPAGNLYWSVTARNYQAGALSPASNLVVWPGNGVSTSNTYNACNASSSGTLVTSDAIANLLPGGYVYITSGTGTLVANTTVANVVSNTQFNLSATPTIALSNACIEIKYGGVSGNNIQSNTVTSNNMTNTGVVAGCYTNPSNVCVDAAGRITSIANGTGGSGILTVQETSVNVVSNVSILNFTGNGVNVSNANGIANIDITAVGGYMQVADNQLITLYGDNGTNAFSTVVRALSTYRIPAQLEFVNSGGSITTQAYTLGADDYYPWYTNTSSTTNNFWANTTLKLQPVRAAYQRINVDYTGGTTLDGYEGWIQPFYGAIDSTFTLANNSTDTTYLCDTSVQLVSDANITVQVGGTVEFSWVANNNSLARYVNYGTVTTIDLIEKRPQTVNLSFTEEGYRVSNVSGNLYVSEMGIAVRNPDSGNVFIVSGNLKITVPTNGPTY
jgi:hypothetical protein